MSNRISRRTALVVAPMTLLSLAAAGVAIKMSEPPPKDLDLSLRKTTAKGLYIASLAPDTSPIPVGVLHSWTLHLAMPDGRAAGHAVIAIEGGMPQHGHGLPTQPQATAEQALGTYRIDGMKFNMAGWWTLTISIDGPQGTDAATFNLVL